MSDKKVTCMPRVGHNQYDEPKKFLILCNGAPFNGADTAEEANRIRNSYASTDGRKKDAKIAEFTIKTVF